jgi:hypothetical protein
VPATGRKIRKGSEKGKAGIKSFPVNYYRRWNCGG